MDDTTANIRRAVLGMPGYGEASAGASQGLWRASMGRSAKVPIDLQVSYGEGSLLAQNFNFLWCTALNEVHQGRRVDYFAMIHADVEPEAHWLDVLIAELEERKLDVLGAVVPIKDTKGLTSIAMERDDGDTWRPLCRLTMREVFSLPETFTADDVGHPLLLNTGLWVCRFNTDWAKKVHFTINDRIVFNTKLNIYQPQVEPEDWYFSRLCNELKLKIGATRKVRLGHLGKHRFTNAEPWGQEDFDHSYVGESQLPKQPPINGWRFPDDVDGWLNREEGIALAELARGKQVLEIGSYCGRSTICMAQTAKIVQSIDPHDGRGTPRPKPTYGILRSNLRRYGVDEKVVANTGTIDGLAGCEPTFDLIFIDGAHDLESVQNDIRHALTLLKPDGLLAFHDYRRHPGQFDGRWDPGVSEAVNELVASGGEILSTHSTVAVVKPPVPILENCNADL